VTGLDPRARRDGNTAPDPGSRRRVGIDPETPAGRTAGPHRPGPGRADRAAWPGPRFLLHRPRTRNGDHGRVRPRWEWKLKQHRKLRPVRARASELGWEIYKLGPREE